MFEQNVVCDCCNGTGKIKSYLPVKYNTVKYNPLTCLKCDGKGWVEVVNFTKKEAELILSRCGITQEELERI